jgi:NADH-quinone oxidoreductase subunit A
MNGLAAGPLWPLVVYAVLVGGVVLAIIALSYVLGERHRERGTDTPYESGMIPTGNALGRFPVEFYLVAVFFVIFDLEAVFLFAWAIALRQVGWAGYGEALIFMLVLGAALVYLWRLGALEWGTRKREEGSDDAPL